MDLAEFNSLDTADAAAVVGVWAAIPAWIDAIVSQRPYASVDALGEVASQSAARWSRNDLDAALAHHPRIGDTPAGTGAGAAASRSEQASMSTAAGTVAARIAAGNAAYEERFGRVFLIRAVGRSPEEMLSELERRLENGADDEASESLNQLTQIALLRLRTTVVDDAFDRSPS